MESTSLKTRRQRRSPLFFALIFDQPPPPIIDHFLPILIPRPFPSSNPCLLYTHMQTISSLADRFHPFSRLFRHSSRNQRYKHARLLAYSKNLVARSHSLASSFPRNRGRENDPRGGRGDPPFSFQPFPNEYRTRPLLVPPESIPCLPTASTPSFFDKIFERKKSREEKRNNKLQQVDDGGKRN